jgi:hypothetical protein
MPLIIDFFRTCPEHIQVVFIDDRYWYRNHLSKPECWAALEAALLRLNLSSFRCLVLDSDSKLLIETRLPELHKQGVLKCEIIRG